MQTGSSAPATATASVLPINITTLHHIMPNAPMKYIAPLNQALPQYHIDTAKRLASFLSQVAVESNELRHTHEFWTNKKNFQLPGVSRKPYTATSQADYFKYWYGNRADLGNKTAEDGYTYRGRGAIQITGRAAYVEIGAAIGEPLATKPYLLETDPTIDMLAAVYFFAGLKRLNPVADSVDPGNAQSIQHTNHVVTLRVNGGTNGQSERLNYYTTALSVLGARH